MRSVFHGCDCSADGSVDIGADRALCFADFLAHINIVTCLYQGKGRGADVLGEGDHDLGGGREIQQRKMLAAFFAGRRVNAAKFAFVFANGAHMSADALETGFGIVADLHGGRTELIQSALLCKTLFNFFPGTVLLGILFALSVFGSAALSIQKTFGAIHYGTDTAGEIQVAFTAATAFQFAESHAVVAFFANGIGSGKNGDIRDRSHCLNTEAAGGYQKFFCSFGQKSGKNFLCALSAAKEICLRTFKGGFAGFFSKRSENGALFFRCVGERFKAFSAHQNRHVVGEKGKKFALGLEPVFHIVVQRNHLLCLVFLLLKTF